MRLVIGGESQGKLSYILQDTGLTDSDVLDGATCPLEQLKPMAVVNHLEALVKRVLAEGQEPKIVLAPLFHEEAIILCNEVGCGLVPMDKFERQWREVTGRLCCDLAREATRVDRVYCGIATTIKGA